MREYSIIEESKKAYTKEELVKDLKALGVQTGDCLLVHSSLSKLGWVIGREVTVVEALIEAVGEEGTLVMPSFSGENSDPKNWQAPPVPKEWVERIKKHMPPFDPILTPTRQMGKIADLFRHYPGTLRSDHPQVSFAARGPNAQLLLEPHQLTPGFGKESPLYRLYEKNAKVLLLGVGYGNCTCMHLGETWLKNPKWIDTGASVMQDGKATWVRFCEIDYDDEDFDKIGEDYEKSYSVQIGNVGQGEARLLEMQSITDFAYQWIQKNRK